MDQSQLQIVIKAVDEASAILKQVSTNAEQMGKSISETNTKTGSSFDGLKGSFTELNSEIQVIKQGFDMVVGAIAPFIEAAIKESATLAQVKVNIDNAGFSYEKLSPLIEEVARKNIMLGFADDDTQLSLSKLVLATGNYNQALALNQLAMDLSRAKNMDLNSATVLVQQVMAGNTRVLKQYGISLDSATTSGEALNILHEKLKNSATAFADSTAGKVAEVNAKWDKMKEDVGGELMPTLILMFDEFEKNLPEIENDAVAVAKAIGSIAEATIKTISIFDKSYKVLEIGFSEAAGYFVQTWADAQEEQGAEYIAKNKELIESNKRLAQGFKDTASEIANAEQTQKDDDAMKKLVDDTQKLADAYNAVHKNKVTADDVGSNQKIHTEALNDYTEAQKKAKGAVDDMATTLLNIQNQMKGANTVMVKHTDAVKQLKEEYDKMASSGTTDLASLSDSFQDKMRTINASIASTRQSITDLTNSYNTTQIDNTKSAAESVVASETKIADIKKQMLTAVGATQYQSLADQLAAEQANYDSSKAFRDANGAAIAEAERRASETDLQRTIEDYNAKQALDAADYAKRLASLQKELKDKQNEAKTETALYQSKTDAINKMLTDANTYFKQLSDNRVAQTTDEVNAEIKKFQQLAAAISAVKSASQSAVGTISTPSLTVAKHESGGFVDAPRGTAVPIIAHGGEMVIPAEQTGRFGTGTNIQVTINNPSVRNDNDIIILRKQIDEVMRPLLQNVKIAHT